MWILPQEAFQPGYDRVSTVIGTGPFMLSEREIDVVTRYVRNPDYWDIGADGEPLPYLDSYDSVVINDTQQVIAQFKAGEIDILTNGIPADLRDQLVADTPDAQHNEWIDAGMGQIGVNMARPPFDDLRVRKAVSMAIDREGQGSTIWIGGTIPSNVAPALSEFALPEEERFELLPYDPEGAKALLAEAGYPDGLPATLIATDGYGARYVQATEFIVEDLNAAGFNITLELLDYSTYFGSRWPDGEYDLQFGPQTPFLEPDEWLRTQMQTDAARNWYNISDPGARRHARRAADDPRPGRASGEDQGDPALRAGERDEPDPDVDVPHAVELRPRAANFYRHASYGFPGIEAAWLDLVAHPRLRRRHRIPSVRCRRHRRGRAPQAPLGVRAAERVADLARQLGERRVEAQVVRARVLERDRRTSAGSGRGAPTSRAPASTGTPPR